MSADESFTTLKPEEVITLSQEIQAMMAAGVPLDLGLQSASLGFSKNLEDAAERIAQRLQQGASVSEAFSNEESIPGIYRAVLVAGLRCGRSEEVLEDITVLTQHLMTFRQNFKLGLIYPIFVIFLAIGLMVSVHAMLTPAVVNLLTHLNLEHPKWLQWMVSMQMSSNSLSVFGVVFADTFIAVLLWVASSGRKSPLSGLIWIPGLARVGHEYSIAQFSSLLALLVKYRIPLPDALRYSAQTLQGGEFQSQSLELAQSIDQGDNWEEAVNRQSSFPPFLKWLLVAGQESSQLKPALEQAATFYQDRATTRSRWLCQFIPTFLVIVFGGGLTTIYSLSVFIPMIDLWEKLSTY